MCCQNLFLKPKFFNYIFTYRNQNVQLHDLKREIPGSTPFEVEDMSLTNNDIIKSNDDIPLEEVKDLVHKYPHMDIVEKEKLQWTGNLPLQVKLPDDPYPARFNFEGKNYYIIKLIELLYIVFLIVYKL